MFGAVDDLLDKRVLIVSGKGGAGKTSIAAALALTAARKGKRVCLVEIEEAESFRRLFGTELGHDPVPLGGPAEGIDAVDVQPREMLREFLAAQIRVKALYSRLFRSPIYRYFVAAAPGLDEVMALGKVYLLAHEAVRETLPKDGRRRPEKKSAAAAKKAATTVERKRHRYDLVVVDAPASGHGVALLRVPGLIAGSVRRGPVKYYADKLVAFLGDPNQVALVTVAQPAEMPVTEAIEMRAEIREHLPIALGPVVANAVMSERFTPEELAAVQPGGAQHDAVKRAMDSPRAFEAALRAMERRVSRREMGAPHLERLREAVDGDVIEVPYLFERDAGWTLIERISKHLAEGLADPSVGQGLGRSAG